MKCRFDTNIKDNNSVFLLIHLIGTVNRFIYEEAKQSYEKWASKISIFQKLILLPIFSVPNLIISLWKYFTVEKSTEALILIVPAS